MSAEDQQDIERALTVLLDEQQITDERARRVALQCGVIGAGIIDAAWVGTVQEMCRSFTATAERDAVRAPGLRHVVRALETYLAAEYGQTGIEEQA